MKTIKDIKDYCHEQEQFAMDRLISGLDGDLGAPSLSDCQFWNGQIKAFKEISELIRHHLKIHECSAVPAHCGMCGKKIDRR